MIEIILVTNRSAAPLASGNISVGEAQGYRADRRHQSSGNRHTGQRSRNFLTSGRIGTDEARSQRDTHIQHSRVAPCLHLGGDDVGQAEFADGKGNEGMPEQTPGLH